MTSEATKPLPPHRQEMMHRIMDGDYDLAVPLYQIYQHVLCDQILKWLIINKITGKEFRGWLLSKFANSSVLMMAYVVKQIKHDLVTKPIIVGKDWIPSRS